MDVFDPANVTAAVLAGGAGSRLGGRDKYDTSKGDAPDQDSAPSSPGDSVPYAPNDL